MVLNRALVGLIIVGLIATAGLSRSNDVQDRACPPQREFHAEAPDLIVEPASVVWSRTVDEATFSSPRVADLDGDGVLDVVQGFGQDTFGALDSSVIATNGATGEQLWRSTGHDDVIGSAVFVPLGGDATVDIVIGGRRGELVALDGSMGSRLWTFDDRGRWFNFYTSQVLPDQDDDDIADLLAVNGGLVFDQPEEGGGLPDPDERHLGTVFVLSGADGSVINSVPVPDRAESYASPVVLQPTESHGLTALIGTGGETLPGSLWQLPLSAVLATGEEHSDTGDGGGDARDTAQLVTGGDKGVIASPVVADLTGDCDLDIVVQAFDGAITLLDGATGSQVWRVTNPGFETYSTPTLGYFVGDDQTPDVFASVARGVWPEYESSDYLLIDGSSGQVVWRETLGTFAPSGFVAGDLNSDGRDEIIFGVNDPVADTQQLYVLDPTRRQIHLLGQPLQQTTFAAPWLGDLDGDGWLDLLITQSSYQPPNKPATVARLQLAWPTPNTVSWGGYLGTDASALLAYQEAKNE